MLRALAAAALFSSLAAPAFAASVFVAFAGTVTSFQGQIFQLSTAPIPITPEEAEAAFGGSLQVGTPFSGFFVYDDAAAPTVGGFLYGFGPGASFVAHAEIGSFAGDGDSGYVELYDSAAFPSAAYVSGDVANPSAPAGEIALLRVVVGGSGGAPGSPLNGVTLSGIPWSLVSFPYASAGFAFAQGDLQVNVSGVVTSLVPEPAGIGLLALATLTGVIRRRVSEPSR